MGNLLAKSQIDIGWTIDLCQIESASVFDWRLQSRNHVEDCLDICLPYSTSVVTAFRKQSESFLSVSVVVAQSSDHNALKSSHLWRLGVPSIQKKAEQEA